MIDQKISIAVEEDHSHKTVVFEVVDQQPDKEGKQAFFVYWWTEYMPGNTYTGHVRAQIFKTIMADKVEAYRQSGCTVLWAHELKKDGGK